MDRLDSMSVAARVAELGSFSAAARALGMPLTTVSRRVADLEQHLKTRLFTRASRRVLLTEAGEGYLASARRILEAVDEAERTAAGEYLEPRGELVLTAPLVFGRLHLLPIVTAFLEQAPEVRVQLQQGDAIVNLLEERVDLALRIGALTDSGLRTTRLGTMRLVTCASPGYLARHGRPRAPVDLARHLCVGRPGEPSWRYEVKGRAVNVPVRSRLVVNTAEAVVDAASAGVGLGRALAYQVDEAVRAGRLELVLTTFELPPSPVSLLHAGAGPVPAKVRAFLDYAAPRLRQRLGAGGLTARSATSRRPPGE